MKSVNLRQELPKKSLTSVDSIAEDIEAKMESVEALADALHFCGRAAARRITRQYLREMAGFPLQTDRQGFEGPGGSASVNCVVAQFADGGGGDAGASVEFQLLDAEFVETRVDRVGDRVPVLRHQHSSSRRAGDVNHAHEAAGVTRRNTRRVLDEIADIVNHNDEIVTGGEA